ncbi:hypothetical protein EPUL_006523, partial [Erysiphe pulchra]
EDMAPTTREKKSGILETLDPKSRVQKPVNNAGRDHPLAAVLTRSAAKTNAVVREIAAVQDTHVVATQLEQSPTLEMNIDAKSESETDDLPVLPSAPLLKRSFESSSLSDSIHNKTVNQTEEPPSIKFESYEEGPSLLKLVGPYLEEMEIDCPGAGAGFLALISEGVSRANRGEEIFSKASKCTDNMPTSSKYKKSSWAATAANGHNNAAINLTQRLPRRPTPPQGQSHEDRRVMVRLNSEHEARKTEPFLLRQQIQRMIPDPSLV